MSNDNKYKNQLENCYKIIGASDSSSKIVLLKGGSYKIKQYYLEDNVPRDIRGASMNLAYVEEKVIPNYIEKHFSRDCIMYNGGGNIFCILPESVDENFAMELENEAEKYLVSANTAYVTLCITRGEFENDYKKVIRELERKLSSRKKLKIFNPIISESAFAPQGFMDWNGSTIKLSNEKCEPTSCQLCKSRIASYIYEDKKVCASCMHKAAVGKSSRKDYLEEYKKRVGKDAVVCDSFTNIDSDHIAVVYGDGNNMGQIIRNFKFITDMMKFSDEVKEAATGSVYDTMKSLGIDRFEVVGLGGDDIFVIVSGKVALKFATGLIKEYNNKFKKQNVAENENMYESTMSVGVCIAKSNTPLRIMLEVAEDKLAEAKELAKLNNTKGKDTGTISYAVLDDPTETTESSETLYHLKSTLSPYTTEGMDDLIEYIEKLKRNKNAKSALRNKYDAYTNSDCLEEAYLFFNYRNAKDKKMKIYAPEIDGWENKNGKYSRNGTEAFVWRDILELYNYVEEN